MFLLIQQVITPIYEGAKRSVTRQTGGCRSSDSAKRFFQSGQNFLDGRERRRAAASSIASGIPSRWRHICAMVLALRPVKRKSGGECEPRSTKSWMAAYSCYCSACNSAGALGRSPAGRQEAERGKARDILSPPLCPMADDLSPKRATADRRRANHRRRGRNPARDVRSYRESAGDGAFSASVRVVRRERRFCSCKPSVFIDGRQNAVRVGKRSQFHKPSATLHSFPFFSSFPLLYPSPLSSAGTSRRQAPPLQQGQDATFRRRPPRQRYQPVGVEA